MKILYIAHFHNSSGYAQAAIDYAQAMSAAGLDVVCRNAPLDDTNEEIPSCVIQLLRKSTEGCDVVIQHTLPYYMQYDGHFTKNIGMFAWETDSFLNSGWAYKLNLMDEIWVFNPDQAKACEKSGVTKPIHVIPHATNLNKFYRGYIPPKDERLETDSFKFYTISEFNRRKNFGTLIKAFHAEFGRCENVDLVIKTNKNITELCNEIKNGLKIYPNDGFYRKEIIISERLKEEELYGLHNACDCFVSTSFGEAWGIPAFDSLGFGKTPIVPNWGGFPVYLDNESGWLVRGNMEPCYGFMDSMPELYSAREKCFSIDISHLRTCLREAYKNVELRKEKANKSLQCVENFSHEAVGNLIKRTLSQCPNVSQVEAD